MTGDAIDSVLMGLQAVTDQGGVVRLAVQVGETLVSGQLTTAAAYRDELAKQLGQPLSEKLPTDSSFLHLQGARIVGLDDGANGHLWYRCPMSAVTGYAVFSITPLKS